MRYLFALILSLVVVSVSVAQVRCDCLRTGVCTCSDGVCQCTQTFVPRPAGTVASFSPMPQSRYPVYYQSGESTQCVWDPATGSWNCGGVQSFEFLSRSERRAWRRLEKARMKR